MNIFLVIGIIIVLFVSLSKLGHKDRNHYDFREKKILSKRNVSAGFWGLLTFFSVRKFGFWRHTFYSILILLAFLGLIIWGGYKVFGSIFESHKSRPNINTTYVKEPYQSNQKQSETTRSDNSIREYNQSQNTIQSQASNTSLSLIDSVKEPKEMTGRDKFHLKHEEALSPYDQNGRVKRFGMLSTNNEKLYFSSFEEELSYGRDANMILTGDDGTIYYPDGRVEKIKKEEKVNSNLNNQSESTISNQNNQANNSNNSNYSGDLTEQFRYAINNSLTNNSPATLIDKTDMQTQNENAVNYLNTNPREFSQAYTQAETGNHPNANFVIYSPDRKSHVFAGSVEELHKFLDYAGWRILISTENQKYFLYFRDGSAVYYYSIDDIFKYIINNNKVMRIYTCWDQAVVNNKK